MRIWFGLASIALAACGVASTDIASSPPATDTDAGNDATASGEDDAGFVEADAGADAGNALVVEKVAPADTDPAIEAFTEDHLVVRDPRFTTLKVLLFFPGSTLLPAVYTDFLGAAARAGYAAIGLRYPNKVDVGDIVDTSDPDCTKLARLEIFDGIDRSTTVSIDVTNSVVHRVVALFAYLDAHHPGEGWGPLVVSGAPDWSRIVVAGHSFGSGMATLIALENTTPRMVMLAGPNDHCDHDAAPAPWLVATGATPSSDRYGFAHVDDPEEAQQLAAWSALGMDAFGAATSVDTPSTPPYGHAHELTSAEAPATTGDNAAHRSTAVDTDTPEKGGAPVFEPVWRDLVGP